MRSNELHIGQLVMRFIVKFCKIKCTLYMHIFFLSHCVKLTKVDWFSRVSSYTTYDQLAFLAGRVTGAVQLAALPGQEWPPLQGLPGEIGGLFLRTGQMEALHINNFVDFDFSFQIYIQISFEENGYFDLIFNFGNGFDVLSKKKIYPHTLKIKSLQFIRSTIMDNRTIFFSLYFTLSTRL